jgi:hypothetical protein
MSVADIALRAISEIDACISSAPLAMACTSSLTCVALVDAAPVWSLTRSAPEDTCWLTAVNRSAAEVIAAASVAIRPIAPPTRSIVPFTAIAI